VLQGKGCQVGISDEISKRLAACQKGLKDRPMTIGRLNEPHARLIQPALDAGNGCLERQWILEGRFEAPCAVRASISSSHRPVRVLDSPCSLRPRAYRTSWYSAR
jgi:hypothetical protein